MQNKHLIVFLVVAVHLGVISIFAKTPPLAIPYSTAKKLSLRSVSLPKVSTAESTEPKKKSSPAQKKQAVEKKAAPPQKKKQLVSSKTKKTTPSQPQITLPPLQKYQPISELSLPAAPKILEVDKTTGVKEVLTTFFQQHLSFPEKGSVTILVRFLETGELSSYQLQKASSQALAEFIEHSFQTLSFPRLPIEQLSCSDHEYEIVLKDE